MTTVNSVIDYTMIKLHTRECVNYTPESVQITQLHTRECVNYIPESV